MRGCNPVDRTRLEEKLTEKRERLQAYREREKAMLAPDGVKSYGVGSRNIQRYDTALKDVQEMIAKLEKEIEQLEGQLCGGSPRKAVGVIPRDW